MMAGYLLSATGSACPGGWATRPASVGTPGRTGPTNAMADSRISCSIPELASSGGGLVCRCCPDLRTGESVGEAVVLVCRRKRRRERGQRPGGLRLAAVFYRVVMMSVLKVSAGVRGHCLPVDLSLLGSRCCFSGVCAMRHTKRARVPIDVPIDQGSSTLRSARRRGNGKGLSQQSAPLFFLIVLGRDQLQRDG